MDAYGFERNFLFAKKSIYVYETKPSYNLNNDLVFFMFAFIIKLL